MMSLATAETLIRRCFAELDKGGFVSFAFQGGEPTLAGLDFFRFFTQTVQKVQPKACHGAVCHSDKWPRSYRGMG